MWESSRRYSVPIVTCEIINSLPIIIVHGMESLPCIYLIICVYEESLKILYVTKTIVFIEMLTKEKNHKVLKLAYVFKLYI